MRLSGLDPVAHYRASGRGEGRRYAPLRALALDHGLWRGHAAMAAPALRALLTDEVAPERAVAGWALARWALEQGEPETAAEAIRIFHAVPGPDLPIGHPGPWLLGVQVLSRTGDIAGARAILDDGVARFGAIPDMALARLTVNRAEGGDDAAVSDLLGQVHAGRDPLVPIGLAVGTGDRFDRLTAARPPAAVPKAGETLPLVTVIVPVFDGGARLTQALSGLLAQSWPALEIVVVDDGSTDDSLAVARRLAARDRRIRVLPLGANHGAYAARNAGFAAARGEFVTVHDADDWSHPQKIEMQVAPLLERPDLQATVSHWVRAGADLEMTRWRMEEAWVYRNVSSLMVRAGLRDVLGYWDRARVNADTEYYYRLIAAFGPASIAEVWPGVPLAVGRTDPASLTMRSRTHLRTQFRGVRRDYMEAAHAWHATARDPSDLYLAEHPEIRPFRIPEEIGMGDPQPAPGPVEMLRASALFDPVWYETAYADVLAADMDPVRHYLGGGAREGRDPGPGFSTGGYRLAQGLGAEINPLIHYETEGRAAGAQPCPSFPGALDGESGPCVMVFAHTSGKTLFGAERSLLGVLERLIRGGARPVVVLPTLRNPDYLEELRARAALVETLPQAWRSGHRAPSAATVAAIRALIARHRPGVVHVNTLVLDAPLIAARAEGVETVVHVRELPAEDAALCANLNMTPPDLRARLLAEADRFVVTAAPAARWLDVPDRVTLRPNAVDAALFDLPARPTEGPGPLRVALISSNIVKKGVADLLEVARRVAPLDPTLRFVLIGPATSDLHALRPWPDNVDFADYAPTPVDALRDVDIVLSLSRFAESFGRTVLEAMAAGRPVVCYDRGAPPDLVEHGRSGLVVPADDVAAAARAVLALSAARGGLRRMGQAARARAVILQTRATAED